ncbi:hypothetical protein E2C01_071423 [Portunus trituberculatus]|uniref:Uncharacterized protein n=1 Tax=Portunus trituberculatus TaxID=210409 RepID=A0A5B7I4X6_PORTR|nr:hypothetical protein [Portunus trituberculatus]
MMQVRDYRRKEKAPVRGWLPLYTNASDTPIHQGLATDTSTETSPPPVISMTFIPLRGEAPHECDVEEHNNGAYQPSLEIPEGSQTVRGARLAATSPHTTTTNNSGAAGRILHRTSPDTITRMLL